MSQNPTDSTDRETGATSGSDQLHDDWPIEGYEGEQTTLVATTAPVGGVDRSVVVYDESAEMVFRARPDETANRFVPTEGTKRELNPTETLGDALEDLGDRLEIESLSEFARERLQDESDDDPAPRVRSETETEAARDDAEDDARVAAEDEPMDRQPASEEQADGTVATPETASFTQSNVSATADHDLAFSGAHTYQSDDGQVYLVERDFEVSLDESDDASDRDSAVVDMTERLLRAEEPLEEERRGDTDILERETTSFTLDLESVDTDREFETAVEERCREWHLETPEPIA